MLHCVSMRKFICCSENLHTQFAISFGILMFHLFVNCLQLFSSFQVYYSFIWNHFTVYFHLNHSHWSVCFFTHFSVLLLLLFCYLLRIGSLFTTTKMESQMKCYHFFFSVFKTTAASPNHNPKAISANDCNIYAKCTQQTEFNILCISKSFVGNLSLDASHLLSVVNICNQKYYCHWKL